MRTKAQIHADKVAAGRAGVGACKRRPKEHYQRMAQLSWVGKIESLEQRFWKRVEKGSADECWPWTGCTVNGYGRINVDRKSTVAPRLAFELYYEVVIPATLFALHRCDNRRCCNPSHIFLGTRTDNSEDRDQKGRATGPKGEAHASHKLVESDVIVIRQLRPTTKISVLARMFSVTDSTISHAANRRTWKHIP